MVNEAQPGCASVDQTTLPVIPEQSGDNHRGNETSNQNKLEVPPVLPPDNVVLAQVRDISHTGFPARLEDHPTNVCPPETPVRVVRVEFGVSVTMVGTVTTRPPFNGTFNSSCTSEGEEVLEGLGGVVRTVSPETVVAGSDTWVMTEMSLAFIA